MKNILVTGSAGFIGANLVMRLLRTPDQVGGDVKGTGGDGGLTIVGLDNMTTIMRRRERSIGWWCLTLRWQSIRSIRIRSSWGVLPTGHPA